MCACESVGCAQLKCSLQPPFRLPRWSYVVLTFTKVPENVCQHNGGHSQCK